MFQGGSAGMRKLPGKPEEPVSVSLPPSPASGSGGPSRKGRDRIHRVTLIVKCTALVALALIAFGTLLAAVGAGVDKRDPLFRFSRLLRRSGTDLEDTMAGLLESAWARRTQQWSTSPPASTPTRHGEASRLPAATETLTKPTESTPALSPDTVPTVHHEGSPVVSTTAAPSTSTISVATRLTVADDGTPGEEAEAGDAALGTVSTTAEVDRRTVQPDIYKSSGVYFHREGGHGPEEPERLPGLRITRRTFTPAELLERFGDTDIVYSFVNGTEVNHDYRKIVRQTCMEAIQRAEGEAYLNPGSTPRAGYEFASLGCMPDALQVHVGAGTTVGQFLGAVEAAARGGADNRDRETDELRHSLRSVEQHVQWHRGRVVMVSPGNHPTWVDGAKNFLSGMCGGAAAQEMRSRGAHLRVTTVHQDALMPYGMRLTADSHVIEQHLWRVRNITAAHMYMNDDYFVNRDVAITDLFNEYGGTIVRTGAVVIRQGATSHGGNSWKVGVLHTQQFNIQELDVRHEDELPESLIAMWKSLGRVSNGTEAAADGLPALKGAQLDEAVDVARHHSPDPVTPESLTPRRSRHFASHAPFVYCTNMMRFFEDRYELEFSAAALHHRGRKARDLFIPFLYNAFIMARPWQASPKFLPYLLALHRSRRAAVPGAAPAPSAEIALDNFDGCGPASLLAGLNGSGCMFAKFMNNLTLNEEVVKRVDDAKPLYFNINAGFDSEEAANQLLKFLHDKFPTPAYLERATAARTEEHEEAAEEGDVEEKPRAEADPGGRGTLAGVFDALMALPVVGLVSDEEGACPLVRSLALAFAGHHRGPVHLGIARGEAGALRATRAALRHRVVSAMPAAACAYGSAVTMGNCSADESAAAVAARVLGDGGASGVVLPSTCGGAGGSDSAARGMRVRGFVVDARTPGGLAVRSAAALREALAVPAQTLALEDFRAVRVGPAADDVVLVLSRGDAAAAAVHWVAGASESDLLVTYPLPVAQYENMSAPLRWTVA